MADISIQDLERLDKTMVLVAFLGLIINVVQVVAISNHSWLKATALSNGQPFTAHLSLASVQFGNDTHPSKDNRFFCVSRSDECSLRQLCATNAATETYSNGMAKYTSKAAWCQASDAGAFATRLLASGLLLGLAATGVTAMYAAQSIPWVADQFDKVEELGFSDQIQKYIIAGGWGALWVFLFTSMLSYAVMIPDTLGWGTVSLEASFGLLRVCFVLASVQCALVVNSLFELWSHDSMKSVWKDFMATKLVSARKALYVLLTIQLVLYFFMVVVEVDWSGLLIVLAAFYLLQGSQTFLILYLVLLVVSVLFDAIHAASLPSFNHMTPGDHFGNMIWLVVFAFKFLIAGALIAHEKLEKGAPAGEGRAWTSFDQQGRPGEQYDDDEYNS